MALTDDQQFQLDIETSRQNSINQLERKRSKLDVIRLAKEVLVENARNKPAEEAGVTAAQIIEFADELINYIGD